MKSLGGDAAVLLRAGRRCGALALELYRLEKALGGAADSTMARWSGTAAASFGAMAHAHRGTVRGARIAVERLGVLTSRFAHELSDAQVRVQRLPENASMERKAIEERINLLRRRFHQQSMQVESELRQLLLRRPIDPPRWTGPVRRPGGWVRGQPIMPPRWTGPVRPPGGQVRGQPIRPPRWTGPIRPPADWTPPPTSVRLLPAPSNRDRVQRSFRGHRRG
ncbi:hypothetical protein [Flexivirga alba]|uniref:WXG100 family type VII secretion target n=1 Tax=Flexivirga alba TaxID=702742 RepID=A0ABW2AMC3_9MICO